MITATFQLHGSIESTVKTFKSQFDFDVWFDLNGDNFNFCVVI